MRITKKNWILILPAVLSCQKTKSPFARDVANYVLVDIKAPDLSGITDNGKEVLNLYRFAADEVDAIDWEQYFGHKLRPLDRAAGKSFVEGYADRLNLGLEKIPADIRFNFKH